MVQIDKILGGPLLHSHKVGDITDLASNYLKLDASNDPITGTLDINVPTATTEGLILTTTDDSSTKNIFEVRDGDGNLLSHINNDEVVLGDQHTANSFWFKVDGSAGSIELHKVGANFPLWKAYNSGGALYMVRENAIYWEVGNIVINRYIQRYSKGCSLFQVGDVDNYDTPEFRIQDGRRSGDPNLIQTPKLTSATSSYEVNILADNDLAFPKTLNLGTSTGTGINTINIGSGSSDLLKVKGTSTLGDGGSTNYTEIKSDGEINLHGTARVTRDLWIDSAGIKAPGSKPATEISFGALENSAWQFSDEGVADNQQTVSWRIAPPYDMDRSAAPIIRIGWSSASSGNCEWQLEYRWLAEDEDCTSAAQETLTVTDAASATSNGLVITTVSGIDAPSSTDASIIFRLKRLSAGANDTISDTVELHGVCFNYTSNKLGE